MITLWELKFKKYSVVKLDFSFQDSRCLGTEEMKRGLAIMLATCLRSTHAWSRTGLSSRLTARHVRCFATSEASIQQEPVPDRHVLFLSRYSTVRGGPFNALFDQLVEQSRGEPVSGDTRVVLVPTAGYAGRDPSKAREDALGDAHRLTEDLDLGACELLELEKFDADPVGLRKYLDAVDPHVIWVSGGNTFYLRHYFRSTGFETLVHERCGPWPRDANHGSTLYVGQSAGSICGSGSVDIAHFKGWDDPNMAPSWSEGRLPKYGLRLAGPDLCIFPHFSEQQNHRALIETKKSEYSLDRSDIVALADDQAFVWSQSGARGDTSATARRFIFGADGSMSQVASPAPLEPLAPRPFAVVGRDRRGMAVCNG